MMVLAAAAFRAVPGLSRLCISEERAGSLSRWLSQECSGLQKRRGGWTLSCHTIQCIFLPIVPKNKSMKSTIGALKILMFRALKEESERSGRSSL